MPRYKGWESIPISLGTFNFMYLWVTWKRNSRITSSPSLNSREASNGLLYNELSERKNTWKYQVHCMSLSSTALSFSEDSGKQHVGDLCDFWRQFSPQHRGLGQPIGAQGMQRGQGQWTGTEGTLSPLPPARPTPILLNPLCTSMNYYGWEQWKLEKMCFSVCIQSSGSAVPCTHSQAD